MYHRSPASTSSLPVRIYAMIGFSTLSSKGPDFISDAMQEQNTRTHVLQSGFLLTLLCLATEVVAMGAPNLSVIRVAAVNTPEYSGLLDAVIADFEKQSGYHVEVY